VAKHWKIKTGDSPTANTGTREASTKKWLVLDWCDN